MSPERTTRLPAGRTNGGVGGAQARGRHALFLAVVTVLAILAHVAVGSSLSPTQQLRLVAGAEPQDFAEMQYLFAELPRLVLALGVGAAFGLCGSVMQQATQNRLVSPLTLGVSSGAWLALVVAAIWFPALRQDHGAWVALLGAFSALGLVLAIVGPSGLSGLPVILAGMAVNMLFASLAVSLSLLDEQATQTIFIWGAGDLTQTGWNWVFWLFPKLAVGLLLFALAPRGLALMRLGADNAAARGLPVVTFLALVLGVCLWLDATAIAAVGMIGFIALLAPNIARQFATGAPGMEMAFSLGWGAALLVATDAIALAASQWSVNLVPSGAAAALVGAPALVLLASRRLRAADHARFSLPRGRDRITRPMAAIIAAGLVAVSCAAFLVSRQDDGWSLAVPDALTFGLRFPRVLAAAAGGAGMALAGVILQRLIRNPLASPYILGMSSGATLAVVSSALLAGGSIREFGGVTALGGSVIILALLVVLGRRHNYAAGFMVLVGISLAALADALVQFALSAGSENSFEILNWMQGSTYRVTAMQAVTLASVVGALGALTLLLRRWIGLISIGDGMAEARGLSVNMARLVLLLLACMLTAAVTATMGPVAFVGLIAPHIAVLLGARGARAQLVVAAVVGSGLMIAADWLGRTAIYPMQLPAGAIASVIGGAYFLFLLLRMRR